MFGGSWRWVCQLRVLLLAALLVLSCKSSLSTNLDGWPCDQSQSPPCVEGYTCDVATNLCHRSASCHNGETVCGAECVKTEDDAKNCGGCGATCTAPEHGQPACAKSRCGFTCDDGYFPCGTVCVSFDDDVDNCGGCGQKCDPSGGTVSCVGGSCKLSCDSPLVECDGACVDVSNDPDR